MTGKRKVALIGAGAVGAYFILGLRDCPHAECEVIAEGGHAEKLRKGMTINGEEFPVNVVSPGEAGDPDVIIVCVKYRSLSEAAELVKRAAGPDTAVVSALNGIDSEDILRQKTGLDIMHGLMKISARRKDSCVEIDSPETARFVVGETDGSESGRVKLLKEIFEGTGVSLRISGNIIEAQWKKLAVNMSSNMPQAVLGVGYGAYADSEHVSRIAEELEKETYLVANACGVMINSGGFKATVGNKKARFSTLQDLDAKRETEIEMFAGFLIRKAKEHGVRIPYTEYTYHAVKALEEKNSGKFDY